MLFFFFQAEDGIRDLVRSRGLGDVYKRQDEVSPEGLTPRQQAILAYLGRGTPNKAIARQLGAVSYTHLTLPTIYSV